MPAVLLTLASMAPAGADELWRLPAGARECRLELVNELGGVRVITAPEDPPSAAVNGSTGLAIEVSEADETTRLTVTRVGSDSEAAPAQMDLIVAPECDVAVGTTTGAVTLDVPREGFPAVVHTVTGDITARIDPDTDATIVFATSGEITTDFGVEIEFRYHAEPAKHGWVALGAEPPMDSGSKKVRLTTRRGAVRLLRPTTMDTAHPVETPHARSELP